MQCVLGRIRSIRCCELTQFGCHLVFNKDLDISYFCNQQRLIQVVDKPTKSDSILDLIVTNLSQFYSSPECKAPLGSSDHSIVFWQPNRVCVSKATRSNANKFPLRSDARVCVMCLEEVGEYSRLG